MKQFIFNFCIIFPLTFWCDWLDANYVNHATFCMLAGFVIGVSAQDTYRDFIRNA